jgi:hypothetical protein
LFSRPLENIHDQFKYIKTKYEKPKLMVNKTLLSKLSTRWELLNFDELDVFGDVLKVMSTNVGKSKFNSSHRVESLLSSVLLTISFGFTSNRPKNEKKSK